MGHDLRGSRGDHDVRRAQSSTSSPGTPGKRTLIDGVGESLGGARGAPIQARRVDGGLAAPVAAPDAGAGRPLPDGARTSMERAFGADFSSVRVHEGPHAAAIGATAFAQGESIHFAPGQFDPGSAGGRELLGHELAHVVQQRAGRVAGPQGHGAAINHDAGLEAEADRAGALAARGERVSGIGADAAGPVAGAAPIQGNFGVELEVQNGWRVWWADKPPEETSEGNKDEPVVETPRDTEKDTGKEKEKDKEKTRDKEKEKTRDKEKEKEKTKDKEKEKARDKEKEKTRDKDKPEKKSKFSLFGSKPKAPRPQPVAKATPIITGPGFELQAEDSGAESAIEFVGNRPGFYTEPEFRTAIQGMAELGKKIAAAGKVEGTRVDPSDFGGSNRMYMVSGTSLDATMQITLGVPLASMPALFELLPTLGGEYGGYDEAVTRAKGKTPALENLLGEAPSGETFGFYLLLRQYLVAAAHESMDKSFPKGIFKLMARTDFHKMFEMLGPQGAIIAKKLDEWVALLVADLPVYPAPQSKKSKRSKQSDSPGKPPSDVERAQQRVLKSQFNYDETRQKPPFRIAVTRDEWLRQMPKEDRLSMQGRRPGDVLVPKKYTAPKDATTSLTDMKISDEWQLPKPRQIEKLAKDMDALYLGMGEYGNKTDLVQHPGDKSPTEAVLVEIRNPAAPGGPDKWEAATEKYWHAMIKALTRPSRHDDKSGKMETDHKAGVAMPQNAKQTEIREKRGELVIKDLEELMIVPGEGSSRGETSNDNNADPGTSRNGERDERGEHDEHGEHDHGEHRGEHESSSSMHDEPTELVDRERLETAFAMRAQIEMALQGGRPLSEVRDMLVTLRVQCTKLPHKLPDAVELRRFCTDTARDLELLAAQEESEARDKREEHAEDFRAEQGGGMTMTAEALAGEQLANAVIHLTEVYRWQFSTREKRNEFTRKVQSKLCPDDRLGYPRPDQQDTPDGRLAFYLQCRQQVRQIYLQMWSSQLGGERGVVIHVKH